MRYFKSLTPDVSIYASGGQVIRWTTVDGAVGWYATERPQNIKALERCIERKVGGRIEEIQEAEYEELSKKAKGAPRFHPDREHLTADGLVQPQRIAPAKLHGGEPAVAGDPNPVKVADGSEPDTMPAAPTAPELRKRGRPRKD